MRTRTNSSAEKRSMKKVLYIDSMPGRTRYALCEDGEMLEFSVERDSAKKIVGNIYKGRVKNVVMGMEAAFVDVGLERNGFLYMGETLVDKEDLRSAEITAGLNLKEGDTVMVQVVKDEIGTKGARVTMNVSLPGRLLVFMPTISYVGISKKITDEPRRNELSAQVTALCPKGTGFVVRTAAEHASASEIEADARRLIRQWRAIEKKFARAPVPSVVHAESNLASRIVRDLYSEDIAEIVTGDEKLFHFFEDALVGVTDRKNVVRLYEGDRDMFAHYRLQESIGKLLERKVVMKNGSYLIIDRTEALTVIDVNTGRYVGTDRLEETVLTTNLLAAEEIARQLRLRNIGGIIICDFIDMEQEEHRTAVLARLAETLKEDRIKTNVVGMTGLGLVEITRKKTRNDNDSILLQQCPYCKGAGRLPSNEFMTQKIRSELVDLFLDERIQVAMLTVHPSLAEVLYRSREVSEDIQTLWHDRRIYVIADEKMPIQEYRIMPSAQKIVTLPENAKMLY